MADSFTMPIIGTKTAVIWRPTENDQVRAMCNHGGQSLAKLAERGGVDWTELDAILADEPYSLTTRDEVSSCKRVHLILRQRAQ